MMDVKKIRIIFMVREGLTDETECSDDMHRAFDTCRQNVINVEWVKEQEYKSIDLKKTDFLVFQSFEGKCFDDVKHSKCTFIYCSRIVGPWCLLTCLVEGLPIPNLPWPISNVAMLNCSISCSHLSKNMKQEMKYRIQCMGGYYTDTLVAQNTHLVTDSVKSEKYIKAAEVGLKVMLPSWVEEVWKTSQTENVHCNDERFNKHHCLPFHNLVICCTGFNLGNERKELETLVKNSGGVYNGQLHVRDTDVLICKGDISTAKYKAARKSKHIRCVTFDWITDSIRKGYALPEDAYSVRKGTSTPTKDGEAINPNFSVLSAISNISRLTPNRYVVEETVNMTSLPGDVSNRKRKSSDMEELGHMVDKIDIKRAKRAGTFLDGCSVYLAGFTPEQREKLCKILNFSGATRYDDVTERITHIIVGDTSCQELKQLQVKDLHFPLLSVKWLIDSIEHQQPAPEENYFITATVSPKNESGSPLSRKGLQLLCTKSTTVENFTKPIEVNPPDNDGEHALIQQYLKQGSTCQDDTLALYLKNNEPCDSKLSKAQTAQLPEETSRRTCSVSVEETTEQDFIYQGLKFFIGNFNEEECNELRDCIESYGGEIVPESYKNAPDYTVVPAFNAEPIQTTSKLVTDYWITECTREEEIREVLYYHRPYTIPPTDVLQGCIITISSYTHYERAFLINLIQHLGAVSQEQLSRVAKENILATTHLLSCEASGKKYAAAIKWKIPVINKDWLLECARTATFVPEASYLIGDSKAPDRRETSSDDSSRKSVLTAAVSISHKNNLASHVKQTDVTTTSKVTDVTLTAENLPTTVTPQKKDDADSSERSFDTTKVIQAGLQNTEVHTPPNRILKIDMNTSDACSQVTPINKILQEARFCHILGTTPVTPKLKGELDDIATPDTPLGAVIRPNPSPHLRKVMQKWLNNMPDHRPRRDSTPLSELRRQFWNKICPSRETQDENRIPQPIFDSNSEDEGASNLTPQKASSNTQEHAIVNDKLLQLQEMLTASGGSRKSVKKRQSTIPAEAAVTAIRDSQPCTVSWDYMDCDNEAAQVSEQPRQQAPVFMLSGVEPSERDNLVSQLQSLGATVSELSSYDPACTHLVCAKPCRNEKMLASMAAGKWILHTSYVEKSVAAGKLLDEEDFEFGNPKSSDNIKILLDNETAARAEAIHWWRKEIRRRGYGAFHDMRALVVASRRDPIVKVIEAGGGMVIDINPPFVDSVYATHCLLDPKAVRDLGAYVPLAKQGIRCVHVLYINNFLHKNVQNIDSLLPDFSKYYVQE